MSVGVMPRLNLSKTVPKGKAECSGYTVHAGSSVSIGRTDVVNGHGSSRTRALRQGGQWMTPKLRRQMISPGACSI